MVWHGRSHGSFLPSSARCRKAGAGGRSSALGRDTPCCRGRCVRAPRQFRVAALRDRGALFPLGQTAPKPVDGRRRLCGAARLRRWRRISGALPQFDWSVTLAFNPKQESWDCPAHPPAQRFRSVRLAVPSRTVRHRQAAVHAVWSPATLDPKDKRTVYYGFRQPGGVWKLVARTDFGEGRNPHGPRPASPSIFP